MNLIDLIDRNLAVLDTASTGRMRRIEAEELEEERRHAEWLQRWKDEDPDQERVEHRGPHFERYGRP